MVKSILRKWYVERKDLATDIVSLTNITKKKNIIKNKIGVSSPGSSLLWQKVAPASKW